MRLFKINILSICLCIFELLLGLPRKCYTLLSTQSFKRLFNIRVKGLPTVLKSVMQRSFETSLSPFLKIGIMKPSDQFSGKYPISNILLDILCTEVHNPFVPCFKNPLGIKYGPTLAPFLNCFMPFLISLNDMGTFNSANIVWLNFSPQTSLINLLGKIYLFVDWKYSEK